MIREFRSLTIGGVFDATVKVLINKDALKLAGIYLALTLPLLVTSLASVGQSAFSLLDTLFPGADFSVLAFEGADNALPVFLLAPLVVIYYFVGIVYPFMAADLYGKRFFETPYRFFPSLLGALKRFPGLILHLLFMGLHTILIVYLFFIITLSFTSVMTAVFVALQDVTLSIVILVAFLAVFLAAALAVGVLITCVMPAFAMDRKNLFRSIGTSFRLVAKDYLRLLGTCFVFYLILIVGSLFVAAALLFICFFVHYSLGNDLEAALSFALPVALAGFGILILLMNLAVNAFNAVIYCNQKVKRDGLGAELLARRFLEDNAAPRGPPSAV